MTTTTTPELTCPLGSKCKEIRDNKEYQCAWWIQIRGKDQTGQDHDQYGCAIAWMPILTLEVAGTNRGQTAAIEEMRNETIKRQTIALEAIGAMRELPNG
jgi:hypothetical protein